MNTLTPQKILSLPKGTTAGSFRAFARKAGFKYKDNGSIVIYDKDKNPKVFAFDAYTLWDILCTLDEELELMLDAKDYVFNNPVGWLIDAIEETLPVNPKIIAACEKAIQEYKRKKSHVAHSLQQ